MKQETEKPSFFVKLATVIVDKRNLIFFLYACALIFCLFSRNWVGVCNDITQYLPETTETRQGLTLMEQEFTTYATARVMVSHVTYDIAANLAGQIGEIEGVSSASFGGDSGTPEEVQDCFKGTDALISVTFGGRRMTRSAWPPWRVSKSCWLPMTPTSTAPWATPRRNPWPARCRAFWRWRPSSSCWCCCSPPAPPENGGA